MSGRDEDVSSSFANPRRRIHGEACCHWLLGGLESRTGRGRGVAMTHEAGGKDLLTGLLRLAGFGGAAWSMRTSVHPGESPARGAPWLCLDVGLLSPDSLT